MTSAALLEAPAGSRRYRHTELREFARRCLLVGGYSDDEADILAGVLEEGHLRLSLKSNQGFGRIPVYIRRAQEGGVATHATIAAVQDSPGMALIDGGRGAGQVVSYKAMHLAIEKARVTGTGVVAVRNSNHFGAAAYYALMAAEHDLVGFSYTNASVEIAPWGGKGALVSTNPWGIGVPAGRHRPIVLDLSNAFMSRNRMLTMAEKGQPLPANSYTDAEGNPTTDPQAAVHGWMMPFGGYKGYGIAVMIELITGALAGASVGPEVGSPADFDRPADVGHLFIVIDPARWQPLEQFKAKVDAYVDLLHASARPGSPVYVPGEIEWLRRDEQVANGACLRPDIERDLRTLSDEMGTMFPNPLP
jgi:LDH2 family malate/lactate/ureidoglycolate dehydrogenase